LTKSSLSSRLKIAGFHYRIVFPKMECKAKTLPKIAVVSGFMPEITPTRGYTLPKIAVVSGFMPEITPTRGYTTKKVVVGDFQSPRFSWARNPQLLKGEKMVDTIIIKDLEKNYGRLKALQGISFTVKSGEIFGLIGPNGAGKTTALRIISTLLQPTSGSCEILGFNIPYESDEVRKLISYLPEEAGAYKNLSGRDYLEFMACFYSRNSTEKRTMVARGIEIAKLDNRIADRVSNYSKGMNRRLLVARALMPEPKLAILDEPTSGLDIINGYEVRKIIKDFTNKENSVLLSSHNMLEVEFLCDRIALINNGLIVEQGKPENLKMKYHKRNIEEVFMEVVG